MNLHYKYIIKTPQQLPHHTVVSSGDKYKWWNKLQFLVPLLKDILVTIF